MRATILTVLAAFAVAVGTLAVAPSARAADPAPVAAYGFSEGAGGTTADASGGGNNGTIAAATWSTAGRYGGALDFNANAARVTIPDAPDLRLTTAYTLEAWVYPTQVTPTWRDVIYKGDDNYYLMATSPQSSRPAIGGRWGTAGSSEVFGAQALPVNTWSHLAATYDGATVRMYVNGVQVASAAKTGSLATSTQPLEIGSDHLYGLPFRGRIDEVRVYRTALTTAQIQTDMNTPIASGGGPADTDPPTVALTAPADGAAVSDIVTISATAGDNVGVAGVQFLVDGVPTGVEDLVAPYTMQWDTRTEANGSHVLTARARDGAGNLSTSAGRTVTVTNTNHFRNEILATGFNLPTTFEFLPDGRMLVAELQGRVLVLPPPYTQASPTPFLQITNIGSAGVQQGIYDMALDPDFEDNHYYYVFYTLGTPNRDRLSRFTANATLTGTVANSELVLYQDPQAADSEHHGGAVMFGNDGKLYFTTGEHFIPALAQQLNNPRGKIHRINPDGSAPTDNPFYDGAGPNIDSVWALGLRNPYRGYFDKQTGRMFIGDVGGNDASTAKEEINLGARGANFGWPNNEGQCSSPCTSPLYWYPHNGRDASVTGGFVYHGTQFPSEYRGNYFFADYGQNWIRRLTFDAEGTMTGVHTFEPLDGSVDGPYGDIVYLDEGPDGALYYIDLGYSDDSGQFGVSKIRRISYTESNQAPTAHATATPTSGPAPLTVAFSSAGSGDPEGAALTYSWSFGDGATATDANPTHTYVTAGQYTARLTVSDGVNSSLSPPMTITVGARPTATITGPTDGGLFTAGDVITFSGTGTDAAGDPLPLSAYTWNVDFLHEGHVHPGLVQSGIANGSFPIPTSGHDFSGNTRYRITLTITDPSSGLTDVKSVQVYPRKVDLTFTTTPPGLTLYLDGIAKTTPFVHDTLVGFTHTVEARPQSGGGTSYAFASWSDGGDGTHDITVPAADQTYSATFTAAGGPLPVAAYAFNEANGTTTADATTNGNTGTLVGATRTTDGKNGAALNFNGTSARVSIPDTPALRFTTGYTLEAWVYPTRVSSAWRDVIYKGNDNYYLLATTPQSSRPGIGGKWGGATASEVFGTTALPVNAWSHLAATYDGTTVRLYVNGVQVASAAKTGPLATSTLPLEIGGDHIYGSNFQGRIDDVRVYSTALTPSQLQTDMNTPVG